jgi:RNA polymerase sigma-70 factor (ECF subfamily)
MNKLAHDEEEQLIVRSQQGEVSAFNQLVLHYQQLLYSTVFRLLGDPESAADVTQDAFLAAFRAINTYHGPASFRAWLLRIGSNMACDHWRRVQRRPASSLEAMLEDDEHYTRIESEENNLTASRIDENPEQTLLSKELHDLIQQGISQLPLEQRTAIVLCDVQGLSYEEIAQVTETSLGTIRSRISRGRTRLRDYLRDHEELLPRAYRLSTNSDRLHDEV